MNWAEDNHHVKCKGGAIWVLTSGLAHSPLTDKDHGHFVVKGPPQQTITLSFHHHKEEREMSHVPWAVSVQVGPDTHLVSIPGEQGVRRYTQSTAVAKHIRTLFSCPLHIQLTSLTWWMRPGLPRFSRSSASVYYTECKPKNKKQGRPGNEANIPPLFTWFWRVNWLTAEFSAYLPLFVLETYSTNAVTSSTKQNVHCECVTMFEVLWHRTSVKGRGSHALSRHVRYLCNNAAHMITALTAVLQCFECSNE